MTSFLPVKLPCIILHNPSGKIWLPPTMSYWGNHLHCLHLFCLPGHPLWKSSHPQLPSHSNAQTVPWPKRQLPLPEPQGSTSIDGTAPKAMQEGPSSSKRQEAPTWFTSLKPSHAEAFLQDSSIIKEARLCFFSNHSYNFVHDGTCDLSDVLKELARSTGLLGEAIYEIQLSWTGPEELKQANYALWSLPKGLRFLRVVPTSESPKVMGLMGIQDLDALWHYAGYTSVPGVGRRG